MELKQPYNRFLSKRNKDQDWSKSKLFNSSSVVLLHSESLKSEMSLLPPDASLQQGDSIDLSDEPVMVKCPHCKCHVITWTRQVASSWAWGLCAILCICMCWPFCFVPFCCSPLEETKHYCPICNMSLGSYKKYKKNITALKSSRKLEIEEDSNSERWV